MTRRLALLNVMIFGLLFWGLVDLNGAMIALAIPLVVYLGAALVFQPDKPQLMVTRTLDRAHIALGEQATVRLHITNLGSVTEELVVEDQLPPEFTLVGGQYVLLTMLQPGGSAEMEYSVLAPRGVYTLAELNVTARDHLGMLQQKATFSSVALLSVFPEVQNMRPLPVRPSRTHGFAGPIPSRKVGAGVNFLGLREYQPGDPLRAVNWRVTARHEDAIFANEYEQERVADVGLILDARLESEIFNRNGSLFEHSVTATASLAQVFLDQGHRVGMLIYGRGLEFTVPGYGKRQRQQIFSALAGARTGSSYAFKSLQYLPTRYFPSRAQLVLVSPLNRDDLSVLTRLRAFGYSLLVVSPDSLTFELASQKPGQIDPLAQRLARVERVLLIRELSRMGVQVVNWNVEENLNLAIQRSVSARSQSLGQVRRTI